MSRNKQKNSAQQLWAKLSSRPIKDGRKELLFSELLSLLSSGLDFSHSFKLLISGETDDQMRRLLQTMYDKVVSGSSLWQAMSDSGRFTALDYGVVRIGEETGRLNESLQFLNDYYHKKVAQSRMVSSALSYPVIIFIMAVVVVIFMLAVVVPMFEQVYSRMGSELPAMTRWIISASQKFPVYAAVIGTVVVGGVVLLYMFRETVGVRSALSSIALRVPLAGNIIKKNYQAHFCKLLYLLTSSGVPLLSGIAMLRDIITFYPYQLSFTTIAGGLQRGELFAANLEKYPRLYSRKLTTLLRVGEETNRLPEMLLKQGEDLTRELEYRLKQMGNMLEPMMIFLIGILVAVILISMYLPMFKLGGVMG
ncbi:type II secretion system F family protein [Alistipes sp. OttesenSCG-928-B03]|nr:type II secretion system F family protein [Alistipes sp. OttesenSCG-928-B03]